MIRPRSIYNLASLGFIVWLGSVAQMTSRALIVRYHLHASIAATDARVWGLTGTVLVAFVLSPFVRALRRSVRTRSAQFGVVLGVRPGFAIASSGLVVFAIFVGTDVGETLQRDAGGTVRWIPTLAWDAALSVALGAILALTIREVLRSVQGSPFPKRPAKRSGWIPPPTRDAPIESSPLIAAPERAQVIGQPATTNRRKRELRITAIVTSLRALMHDESTPHESVRAAVGDPPAKPVDDVAPKSPSPTGDAVLNRPGAPVVPDGPISIPREWLQD